MHTATSGNIAHKIWVKAPYANKNNKEEQN